MSEGRSGKGGFTGALCEQGGLQGIVQRCCCASSGSWRNAVLFVEGMVNGDIKEIERVFLRFARR